jgi:hypothetical protein
MPSRSSLPPLPVRPRLWDGARPIVAALLGVGAFLLACAAGVPLEDAPELAAMVAVATLLLGIGVHQVAGAAAPPSWRTDLAAGLSALAPLLGLLAWTTFSDPLVRPPWIFRATEGAGAALAPLTILVAGGAGALLAAIVAAAERRRVSRRLPAMGLAVVALAGLLCVAGALRARYPSPERYIASLPVAGVVPRAAGAPTRLDPGAPWSWDPSRIYETKLGDVLVTRVCAEYVCGVVLGPVVPGRGLWGTESATTAADSPLTLRHDARHELWFVEHSEGIRALRGGQATGVRIDDVADGASAPPLWIGIAAGGVLVAGLLLLGARGSRARIAQLRRALTGVAGEDGWIMFDEALAPMRAPVTRADADGDDSGTIPAGPVVVFAGSLGGPSVYRGQDPATPHQVLPGHRDDLIATAHADLSSRSALAIAIVLITAAPLLAASWIGLVI